MIAIQLQSNYDNIGITNQIGNTLTLVYEWQCLSLCIAQASGKMLVYNVFSVIELEN